MSGHLALFEGQVLFQAYMRRLKNNSSSIGISLLWHLIYQRQNDSKVLSIMKQVLVDGGCLWKMSRITYPWSQMSELSGGGGVNHCQNVIWQWSVNGRKVKMSINSTKKVKKKASKYIVSTTFNILIPKCFLWSEHHCNTSFDIM